MKKLTHNELRTLWIEFFQKNDHFFLEPLSLIPQDDNSLLFINSGVATLKKYFDGSKTPPHDQLVNIQKAIRTNDIENVGKTARHQTFFEMIGNFSIGNYFKEGAINLALDFLTNKKYLAIPIEKLYITVFEEDHETYDLWIKHGIDKNHIIKGSRKTNFWEIGQGPCGPNTEIFYDRGLKYDSKQIGLDLLKNDIENDRYIEIWNIVFSEFNKDEKGNYKPLPRKNIDTGAGLERIIAISQDVPTNFDTDLFLPIIKEIEKYTTYKYQINNFFENDKEQTEINYAFKVIADHIRAITFAIADNAIPTNSGRGYVLRRLLRRSLIFSKLILKTEQLYFTKLTSVVAKEMNQFYPHLEKQLKNINQIVKEEEENYLVSLERGKQIALKEIEQLKNKFNEKNIFHLYETYGLPIDLTLELLKPYQIKIDFQKIDELILEHQNLARQAQIKIESMVQQSKILLEIKDKTDFVGYDYDFQNDSKVLKIIKNDKLVNKLKEHDYGLILVDKTPFYPIGGGQVSDTGSITNQNGKLIVKSVFKGPNQNIFHLVEVDYGTFEIDDLVNCKIDSNRRRHIEAHHSSTHLTFKVIENDLKVDLNQASAYYDEFKFRFAFFYQKEINHQDKKIEWEISLNKWIKANYQRSYKLMKFEEAKAYGATYIEGLDYAKKGDTIRVVEFGDKIAVDICGGTHVNSTKDLELLAITNIERKGANVYQIEGVSKLSSIIDFLKSSYTKWEADLQSVYKYNQQLIKEVKTHNEIDNSLKLQKILSNQLDNYQQIIKNKLAINQDLVIIISNFLTKIPKLIKEIANENYQLEKILNQIIINQLVKKYQNSNNYLKQNDQLFLLQEQNIDTKLFRNLIQILINNNQNVILGLNQLTNSNQYSAIVASDKTLTNDLTIVFKGLVKKYNLKGGGNKQFIQFTIPFALKDKVVSELEKELKLN